MAQDRTPPAAAGTAGGRRYTDTEQQALSLAEQLRERVHRERETVANLQAYLSGGRKRARAPHEQRGQ